MSKHTPGPWYHSDDELWACATSKPGASGKIIAEALAAFEDTAKADARLIAPVPDLLRIVRTFVDALGNDCSYGDTIDAALAEGAEILRRLDHE